MSHRSVHDLDLVYTQETSDVIVTNHSTQQLMYLIAISGECSTCVLHIYGKCLGIVGSVWDKRLPFPRQE